MKNIHLSEIIENREVISFTWEASVKDLILCQIKNWRINQFYIINDNAVLIGTISKIKIMEYLAPLYCVMENSYQEEFDKRLAELKACTLMDEEFPYLTMKQYLTEALIQMLNSGSSYLPVICEDGCLVGEVTVDDLVKVIPVREKELLYA
ncbi:MAG: CBS domain-containing protein [Spirochaetales bacterium]|uniref:CBS domain-containing protein n=1 Tax=Candidatus Thalassospirochaeta sargassi TaxID=3119039 RepID=A0AAJ1IEB0_9SPIO|nr:CBS domain-containing protein [Spirochaetales bacterium]